MKLGAYTACLHDLPLPDALKTLADMGLTSAEVNSGGFLPAPHLPIAELLESADARSEYLGLYDDAGIELTALNCNGNPLDPDPEGAKQAQDLLTSIELAAKLGVKRVVTMSGAPGAEASSTKPVWNVLPWHSAFLEIRDYQWNEVAIPFWKKVQDVAADADVKVCIEMHPGNVVFNPRTLERLVTETNATHVGAEMDPSHLFWQGIDPTEATKSLGLAGLQRRRQGHPDQPAVPRQRQHRRRLLVGARWASPSALSLGGRYTLGGWPKDPSWDFVAVGRGHDVDWWTGFLAALAEIDPDMPVNIEHEDQELDQLGGLRSAAETLITAAGRI